jgi:hypothetical protein
VYLNAGLMVGTAANLERLIDDLQMANTEDDQAVLTDFMHTFPDRILLDYGQTMFGNNRGGLGGVEEDTCMFFTDHSGDDHADHVHHHRLVHTKTGTSPLFVHSPGGFLQCHDDLAAQLGLPTLTAAAQRRRMNQYTKCKNYKKCAPPVEEEDEDDDEDSSSKDDSSKDDSSKDDKDDKKDKKKDKKKKDEEDTGVGGGDGYMHGWAKGVDGEE